MKQAIVALTLFFVILYLLPLGVRPLVVPDESRYAEIPREMLATGDWVVPRINGLRYFRKPPLGYWLTAFSLRLWGEHPAAVRWPSAMAAGLSALLLAWFVRRATNRNEWALLSAVVFLTSLQVFALGIFNVLDGVFSSLVTASLVMFYLAYTACGRMNRGFKLAAFGIFCGLAFLAEGFLAFVIPGVVIVPFLLTERRWQKILIWPWIPLATAALVVLPWGLAIYRREPDFWRYFVWVEHVQRFASRENAQHAKPLGYYIPVLLSGFLPWTFLLPAILRGLWKSRPWPSGLRFAALAFLAPFVFLSISRGKIGTYILPCLPWLAACASVGLWKCEDKDCRGWILGGLLTSAVLAGLVAALFLYLQVSGSSFLAVPYAEHETWKGMLVTAGLGFWAMAALFSVVASSPGERWALYALSPALLMFAIHWAIPETFHNRKAPEAFLRQFADRVPPEAAIVTDNDLAHLVCWVFKRNDVYLLQAGHEFAYGLSHPDAEGRYLTIDSFNELIRRHAPEGPVVLIADKHALEREWKGRIPQPGFQAENEKFFIATFRTPLRR